MFQKLFNPDNGLMITMSQIADCIFLSMFWFICCLPLVTAGAATAALYDAVYHGFRKQDKHCWQRYWRSFRSNLKTSLFSSLLFVGILAAMTWAAVQLWNSAVYGQISWTVFAGGAFLLFTLLGILSILFPMHSRFHNSTGALWGNTLRLGLGKLPLTMGLAAINAFSIFLCVVYVIPVFVMPALACLLGTLFIEPMFRPFMPDEDAA